MKILLLAILLAMPVHADKPAPIVFLDIAGPDDAALAKFYNAIFGWSIGSDNSFTVPVSATPIHATIRKDPAAKMIYVGVPDVAATLKLVVANGGKVIAPRFEVKGVVVLGLFSDPAGNGMGLVELTGDKPKIP
jgi:predicted enzyme related to lactoylglutathione lyase